jgi:hypothetical protein
MAIQEKKLFGEKGKNPGFSYLHARVPKENSAEVLLTALGQGSLDGRVAEALPWVAWYYAKADSWLVENARKFNLQNRLGLCC